MLWWPTWELSRPGDGLSSRMRAWKNPRSCPSRGTCLVRNGPRDRHDVRAGGLLEGIAAVLFAMTFESVSFTNLLRAEIRTIRDISSGSQDSWTVTERNKC